jgi:hypothetical protein
MTLAAEPLTEDEAREILAPYIDEIEDAVREGWLDFGREYVATAYLLTTRSRATIVHDHVIGRLQRLVDRRSGLRLTKIRGMDVLIVADRLMVRFKKLDPALRASNIPTAQALQFDRQQQLPGMPPALANLTAGYQLDRTNSAFTGIFVVCRDGKQLRWAFEVERNVVAEIQTNTAAPAQETPSRVRLRNADRQQERPDDAASS